MTNQQEEQARVLMIRAQEGDAPAYAALLVLLAGAARHYARHRIGNVPWLEDVTQETLLTIHRARRTYDRNRPFAPWFYAILSTRLIDVLRKERRVTAREVAVGELPEPAAAAEAVSIETGDPTLHSALHALPERQRRVVTALKLQDRSVKEVSREMGMSESAVKVTAHRGYRALRKLLSRMDA
jgi:RNA polymerase sigma-70 factor (ECF subfamily)